MLLLFSMKLTFLSLQNQQKCITVEKAASADAAVNLFLRGLVYMNIYVGNLNYTTQEKELEDLFRQYGEVASVRIISDRDTQRSKGFGFVEMPDEASAQAAIISLNGEDFMGRPLKVNQARERRRE